MIARYIYILLLSVMFSCTPDRNKNDYTSSAILHNSMMKKALRIEGDLYALRHDTLPREISDSVEVIANQLSDWRRDVVEVPGNDAHAHPSRAYDHARTIPEVTPDQMLEIQKELDARLSAIGKKLAPIKKHNDTTHVHQHN